MKTPKKLINAVEQYKSGNEDAFNSIYEASYKKLYTCLMHIVQNEDAANDILQDTYNELKNDASNFKTPWEFLNIALVTGSKLGFDYLKQNNNGDIKTSADDTALAAKVGDNESFLSDKLLQNKEKIAKIREVIDGLSDLQRLCVVISYYAEKKPDAVAEMLNIYPDDVNNCLDVFKARLKEAAGSKSSNNNAKLYSAERFMHRFFTSDVEASTSGFIIPAIGTKTAKPDKEPLKPQKSKLKKSEAIEKPETSKQASAEADSLPDESGEETKEEAREETKTEAQEETNKESHKKVKREETQKAKLDENPKEKQGKHNVVLTIFIALCTALIGFFAGIFYMNHKTPAESTAVNNEAAEESNSTEKTEEITDDKMQEPEEVVYLTEITGLDKFDDYGKAYGGIIPVAKDGKFGAINYQGEVVVPCEHESCYSSADDSGSFILADGDVKKVFDSSGRLVYEGADDVRVSGGMYIILEYDDSDYSGKTVFCKTDGQEVLSFPCEYGISHINVFYDGICTVQQCVDEETGGDDDKLYTMIGTVTTDGKVSWRQDESYLLNNILSTENHGYYVSRDPIVAPTVLNLYDTNGELVSSFDFGYLEPDSEKGFAVSDTVNEENMFYGFWANGGYLYNYGSKMVFGVGDKKVLVDFTKAKGMQADSMTNDIVTAVYDEILLADEKYWLVGRDGKWGYIDQDGNEMHMYDDASAFSHGKAFVVENGNAYLIDESFEKIQDMGAADRVALRGELLYIEQAGQSHVYMVNQ